MNAKLHELENRLFNQRKNKGNIKLFKSKIEALELELYYCNVKVNETEEEKIEGLSLHAQIMSTVPRFISNEFYSIVESCLEKMSSNTNPETCNISKIILEIESITAYLISEQQKVEEIDILLEMLSDKQQLIIQRYYIANIKNLYEVAKMYFDTFKTPVGKSRVRQIKREALESMVKTIERIKTQKRIFENLN